VAQIDHGFAHRLARQQALDRIMDAIGAAGTFGRDHRVNRFDAVVDRARRAWQWDVCARSQCVHTSLFRLAVKL